MKGSQRLDKCIVMLDESIKTGNAGLEEFYGQGDRIRLIQNKVNKLSLFINKY